MSMRRNVYIKAEQIARFIIGGTPLTQIALKMGMSYEGLRRIIATDEYQEIEHEVKSRVLGVMDAKLDARTDMRQKLSDEMEDDAVPEAFRILIDNVKKKKDLKAALEVLDRDPRRQFAKGAAAAAAAQSAVQQPQAARPQIDRAALSQAMSEADITHTLLKNQKDEVKPAEA